MRWGALTSLGGIVAITVLGASYLTFGVVRADPFADYNRTTMVLTDSGGLGVGSPVLLTGLEVGRVTAVRHTAAVSRSRCGWPRTSGCRPTAR